MKPSPRLVKELRLLEESLWRYEQGSDFAYLRRISATDFTEVGGSGKRYTRAELLRTRIGRFEGVLPLRGFSVRMLEPTTALVTYDGTMVIEGVSHHSRRTSIWSRVRGAWRLRFHQGTPYGG